MAKSLTLTELIVAVVLMGVVIMGAWGIYNAAYNFYTASEGKSQVLNDLSYLLDHMDKNVYLATGWIDEAAITVPPPGANTWTVDLRQFVDPNNFNNTVIVTYTFDANSNQVTFDDGISSRVLTHKFVYNPDNPFQINFDLNQGLLEINNLYLCYNPGQYDHDNPDEQRNPTISTRVQKFSTLMQSTN